MMKILVINGPNLNLLGMREKNIYGEKTLEEINKIISEKSLEYGFEIEFFQSNHEGEIIDKIQNSFRNVDYFIMNLGAYTHYSIGIRDAILGISGKVIEVHLSNIYSREEFRHKSVIADIAIGQITGFGYNGYLMAIDYLNSIK